MIYVVYIKGFSVGITRVKSEAVSWLSGMPHNHENRIEARRDEVYNHRGYKC